MSIRLHFNILVSILPRRNIAVNRFHMDNIIQNQQILAQKYDAAPPAANRKFLGAALWFFLQFLSLHGILILIKYGNRKDFSYET